VSLKLAIVVGVIVAVLFVGVLALGGGDGEGEARTETENDDGVLGLLLDRAGDPSLVPLEDISADCANPGDPTLLEVGILGCAVAVTNDGSGIRTLRLSPIDTFTVTAPAPEGDVEVTDTFEPDPLDPDGDDALVAVGEGTTLVSLTCGACDVRMVTG
jgi:hypothetical protein